MITDRTGTQGSTRVSPKERTACFLFLLLALGSSIVFAASCNPGAQPTEPGVVGTPLPPDLAAGRDLFLRKCGACHPGGRQGSGPAIGGDIYSAEQIRQVIRNGKRQMPGFPPAVLGDEDVEHIILYMRTLK